MKNSRKIIFTGGKWTPCVFGGFVEEVIRDQVGDFDIELTSCSLSVFFAVDYSNIEKRGSWKVGCRLKKFPEVN